MSRGEFQLRMGLTQHMRCCIMAGMARVAPFFLIASFDNRQS